MKPMNWYYQVRGGHTWIRIFHNGGKCGDICMRNEEFEFIRNGFANKREFIEFINEDDPATHLHPSEVTRDGTL